MMKFNRITYRYDKKNKRYRFFYDAEYFESGNSGHHICSGNYFDVYSINKHLVAIKFSTSPVYCCDTFNELCDWIRQQTGCIPELLETL